MGSLLCSARAAGDGGSDGRYLGIEKVHARRTTRRARLDCGRGNSLEFERTIRQSAHLCRLAAGIARAAARVLASPVCRSAAHTGSPSAAVEVATRAAV